MDEFEKAVKLDQTFGGAVISENFAKIVKPIKGEAVFSAFCEKLKLGEGKM